MTRSAAAFDPLLQPLRGAHAIEASAGTGKTYSITLLWLRLLVEEGLRVDRILVTTFTRAATAELQERLLAALRRALAAARGEPADGPEARIVAAARARAGGRDLAQELEAALSAFDLAPISTIHGFCQAVIGRQALELGCDPDLALAGDIRDRLRQAVDDHLLGRALERAPDPDRAERAARAAVGDPLGRLLDPIDPEAARRRRDAIVADLTALVATVAFKRAATRDAVLRKIAAADDDLSEAQLAALSAHAGRVQEGIVRLAAIDQALAAAAFHPCAAAVRDGLPRRLAEAGVRTFDDILLTVHRALEAEGGDGPLATAVRGRFAAAIVDECQDSDGVQIGVFRRLFLAGDGSAPGATAPGVASFIVIGDPKQSIYRFRGADLGSYRALVAGAQPAGDLLVNRRSDAALVAVLNDLYRRAPVLPDGLNGAGIPYLPVAAAATGRRFEDPAAADPALLLWSDAGRRAAARRLLAARTADEIRRLLAAGTRLADAATGGWRPLQAGDCAVLAADHADLRLVRQALHRAGIPSQLAGASLGTVWASDEALDVLAWLQALDALDRGRDPLPAMLALAATPLGGLDGVALAALRQEPGRQAAAGALLRRELEELRRQGPLPVLVRRLGRPDLMAANLGAADGERRLTNHRQVGTLLHGAWMGGQRTAAHLARWLARAIARPPRGADEADLVRLETDLPAVALATIHAAKGLEWPVVACPFLWQVRSRSRRADDPAAVLRTAAGTLIDIGSPDYADHRAQARQQEDEEGHRLLYVALTRARHRLYLGLAPVEEGGSVHANGAERSPLAALLGLAAEPLATWRGRLPLPVAPAAGAAGAPASAPPGIPLATAGDGQLPAWEILRTGSYSSLTPHATPEADAWARERGPESEGGRQPGDPGLLRGLGGGTVLGDRVHALLEDVLGNGRDPAEAAPAGDPLAGPLAAILDTPLALGDDLPPLRLGALRGRAVAEMHLLMPVRRIDAAGLARALLADPWIAGDDGRREWAESVGRWEFAALHGYLQGYIDLVFPHGGRWFIADYKTNWLRGYGPDALDEAMRGHHYLLQAWIYALALHRHLRHGLPGYDYDRDLGGCAYLFVRGFPAQGQWFRKPARAAIEALDALLLPAAEDAP